MKIYKRTQLNSKRPVIKLRSHHKENNKITVIEKNLQVQDLWIIIARELVFL